MPLKETKKEVIVVGNGLSNSSSIPVSVNILLKGMNTAILLPAMGK